MICSFIFFTLLLRTLIQLTGISPNLLRYAAILVIGLFGLVMLFPALSTQFAKLTAPLAKLGSTLQSQQPTHITGLVSGFILGISLGLIWTPCAGPILATIITLTATNQITWNAILLVLVYSLGAAIPMFLIVYGGQRMVTSSRLLARHSEEIRKIFGGLMILSALMLTANLVHS